MKCPKCGKEIANDSQFCEYCGAQIKETTAQSEKSINIRWALIPAMIIATIAMYFAYNSWRIRDYGGWNNSTLPALVIAILLFGVSCWMLIKKFIPISAMIVMGLLLTANIIMFYGSIKTINVYQYSSTVYWDDEEDIFKTHSGIVELSLPHNDYINNESAAESILWSINQHVVDDLTKEGRRVHGVKYKDFARIYHYYPRRIFLWSGIDVAIASIILYLLYIFIAYKKGWKF